MLKTKNYSTIVCLGCWGAICCFASFEVEVACFKRCISFLVHNYKSGHSDWLLALQSAIFFHQFPGRHSPMPRPMPNNSNQRIYAFFPPKVHWTQSLLHKSGTFRKSFDVRQNTSKISDSHLIRSLISEHVKRVISLFLRNHKICFHGMVSIW